VADRNQKLYRVLTRNMVLLVVGVALAPLILTGIVLLSQFQEAYRAKVIDHLAELVQKHSQNIDGFLTDRLANIRVVARSYSVEMLADGQFLRRNLALLREENGGVFVDLGLIDSQGIQQAYAGPFNLAGVNYAEANWFRKARQGEHFISDVFTGLRGTPHFIVAVRQSAEGRDWILRATIDFEAFNALVENISIGQTGFAFILNHLGEFQTKPRYQVTPDRSPNLDFFKSHLKPDRVAVTEKTDQTGRKLILAEAPLKGGEWILCYQQESDDAFAQLHHARRVTLAILLIGGLLIVVVAFVLSRRMVNRIAEANKQKAIMNDKVVEAGRLASIGELAAGIAHEINNPVAIMVEEAGWIGDLLADEDPTSEENLAELKRAVNQIQTQGTRCKEITHKLLSFARKTDPDIHEVSLSEVVEDVIDLLKQKTRYANVEIKADLDPDMPPVAASPSELQQVLLNLINNAVDAIDASGGKVTVTTREDNGEAVFEVADTGQGIPEAILPRIFDPFFTTKPVGQGTGLGLSICHGIIHKLGGAISVRSEVGQGTAFTVRLPVVNRSTEGGS